MTTKFLAYHFDLKRPMWKREYMDSWADRLRGWGFNTVVYEIEDKFCFTRHPTIVHPEAPSHEATADFVRSCRAKGLEVVPLMQSLGHAESVVGKPAYAHLREAPEVDDQYDPLSDEARRLILDLYDEIIDVMQPREFFHMGGDETWSLGVGPKSRPLVKEIGIGGLYLRHMRPIFEHLRKRGLRPIIWADIVLSHPEIIQDIPKYVVLMDWDYGIRSDRGPGLHIHAGGALNPQTGHRATLWGVTWADYAKCENSVFKAHFEKFAVDGQTRKDGTFAQFYGTDALLAAGLDVITASANRSCGDMTGISDHDLHLSNCFHSARKGLQSASGHLVTSWAVRHNHPEVTHPSTFATAYALSHGVFDARAIYETFTRDFYDKAMPEFADAVDNARQVFWAGESRAVFEARKRLERGEDPLPSLIEAMERKYGGRAAAIARVQTVQAGYEQARRSFEQLKSKARQNAHNLDFWLEGVDLHIFYAAFTLSALAGHLAEDSPALLARLGELRENTRRLFSETYLPQGVADEIEQRYGVFEKCLRE